MHVRVRLYGTLRRLAQPATPGRWEGEIPPGTQIEGLIRLLGTLPGEVYVASIDGVLQPFTAEVPAGAEVILAPPVGGGGSAVRGNEIRRAPAQRS
jgi:molybdopterin converting factor small subunit